MELNYQEIVAELKKRFPEGTVQHRNDNSRAYIPNQVYTDRVEQATQSQWNKEIKEIDINVPNRYVKVVIRIHIGPHFRDGYGFAVMQGDPTNDPYKIENAVDQAVNDAFREALDSYEMGWKDLAPYKQNGKDWGSNPALKHLIEDGPPPEPGSREPLQPFARVHHKCINPSCSEPLTHSEWELLGMIPGFNRERMTFCFEHLAPQWRRKLPENKLKAFEAKWAARKKS